MTRRSFGAGLLIGLALAALAAFGAWRALLLYDRPGPLPMARDLVVPRGNPGQLGAGLQAAGIVADARAFRVAAALTRLQGPLHAAELTFPAGASLREVLDILRHGRPVQHLLTLPEGLTAAQIADILRRTEALDGAVETPAEGALLPQTYAFERGTARAALAARARAAMDRALAGAWDGRAPGLPLSGARDLLVLASIVEHETGRTAERPHVAAVYLNRLRLGMKLQSDPTVVYGLTSGGEAANHRLTREDLERDTPYNTYLHPGLPPGPIDSPGLAAMQAVAHPADSGDLYFVADGTGGHAFAETLEAHQRNVVRYRALLAGAAVPASTGAQAAPVAVPAAPAPRHPVRHPVPRPRRHR